VQRHGTPTSTADRFVRGGASASFVAFLARFPSVSMDRLVRGAGIDPSMLRALGNADALLRAHDFIALLESAARESGDACFGLDYAEQIPWKDLGVLGYLMLHSPTLGAGLENACRYLAVQQTAGTGFLRSDRGVARLVYTPRDEQAACAQHVDTILVAVVRYCRDALGDATWAPREIHVRRNAPLDANKRERHRAFFGCPVRFGVDENALLFDAALLDAPARTADAALFPILQRHADAVLAQLPKRADLAEAVRSTIASSLSSGDVNIEHVARKLALSTRTLQRVLRDEAGVTFQELLAETRLALARRYLADDTLSITDAALLLGYADLTAFSRACRRWTGKSPQALRRA
jgi:AraC-like DNA-binding protein